jgi:hypothetical protein
MRYLLAVIDTETGNAGDRMAAIDAFNDKLEAAGQRLLAVGITAPSQAKVVDGRNGASVVTPGPLHNTTEYMSGMWIISADSDEEAEALALEGSAACGLRIELRRILGN